MHSRLDDPLQKIGFADGRWVRVEGGRAVVEHDHGNVYLALSLRNVGAGIAVLHGWHVWPDQGDGTREHVAPEDFRMLTRDLLIPPNDIGLWQGAIRDPEDEGHGHVTSVLAAHSAFALDLLYSDGVGGQRSISRFSLVPTADDVWLASVFRHWSLDGRALH